MRIDAHGLRDRDARNIYAIRAEAAKRRKPPEPTGHKPEYRSLEQILAESLGMKK